MDWHAGYFEAASPVPSAGAPRDDTLPIPQRSAGPQADDWGVAIFVAWSRSPNPHLRDWATARLALHEADGEEIRAALLAQLAAPAGPVRDQALLGLALRGDGRAVGPLVRALAEPRADEMLIVAAACLAAPELIEPLESLRRRGGGSALEAALERCRRPA